jgi:hypothetical protein
MGTWDNIQIKKGKGGCGDVTPEQKNNLIEHAVSTWEGMGLSDEQIAFGIGVMGLESGFNPRAKGVKSDTESGLGQFIDDTWKEAVHHYNTRPEHATRLEADIDPDKGRDDPDSQIAVMGPWLRKTWDRAGTIPARQRPSGYRFEEIAYGKWHGGQNKKPDAIGQFLADPRYNNPNMRDYFILNVDRARQALRMRKSASQPLGSFGVPSVAAPGGQ